MSQPSPSSVSADLQSAFDAWCAHQRVAGRLRRGSSEAVYRAMWQALASWCVSQAPPLRLRDLQPQALSAYLASRTGLLLPDGGLTPRYRQRLVSLVQRVQAHRNWLRQQRSPAVAGAGAFSAPPDARPSTPASSGAGSATEPPLHLSPVDALQLQRLLCGVDAAPDGRWQTARDRCAAALQLGGGLGPGDLRALRLGDVISDGGPVRGQPWQLRVAANGSAPAHVSPLAPWAGALLARWLALRETQALGGDWLFPATRSGKPWGKVAQYESARRVLADAGLDPDGGGSFRLRHSFAMRQLLHGHNADLVARWLGVVDPSVMARYQRALGQPPGSAGTPAGTPATASRMPVMPV